jgi:hypothetical protein
LNALYGIPQSGHGVGEEVGFDEWECEGDVRRPSQSRLVVNPPERIDAMCKLARRQENKRGFVCHQRMSGSN